MTKKRLSDLSNLLLPGRSLVNRRAHSIYAILIFCCSISTVRAAKAATIISGQYGALTISVSGGSLTGTFFDGRGEPGSSGAPPFTCIFLLKGTVHGNSAEVITWIPGEHGSKVAGTLRVIGDQVSLTLKEEQAGCLSTGDSMVSSPWTETLTRGGTDWVGVSLIQANRAILYPSSQITAQKRPYLVQFDPVVVLERKPRWAKVTYLYGDRPITGWLDQSALVLFAKP